MLTETFGLFTDAALTVSYGSIWDLIHFTDESDNPQTTTLYFGSLGSAAADTADRQVQALSDPGVDQVLLSLVDILPDWEASHAYAIGDCVQPLAAHNGLRYRCTDAGTSDSVEPVWPVVGIGSTVIDDGVIWTLVGAKHETTEVTLALTEAALATNIPGDPLALGHTVTSGTANKKTIWVQVNNNVNVVSNNVATPEIQAQWNTVFEAEVP